MRVWRLTKTRYAERAFDGEGARLHGGRWNSRGSRVAYASDSSALAVLEVLVHLSGSGVPPLGYSLVAATIPDHAIEQLPDARLPHDWQRSPIPSSTQRIGDAWLTQSRTLALRVPSVIVEGGWNLLINPLHEDAAHVVIDHITPYAFDPRLLR